MLFSAVCGKRLHWRLMNLKRFFVCFFLLLFLKKRSKAISFYLLWWRGGDNHVPAGREQRKSIKMQIILQESQKLLALKKKIANKTLIWHHFIRNQLITLTYNEITLTMVLQVKCFE